MGADLGLGNTDLLQKRWRPRLFSSFFFPIRVQLYRLTAKVLAVLILRRQTEFLPEILFIAQNARAGDRGQCRRRSPLTPLPGEVESESC